MMELMLVAALFALALVVLMTIVEVAEEKTLARWAVRLRRITAWIVVPMMTLNALAMLWPEGE